MQNRLREEWAMYLQGVGSSPFFDSSQQCALQRACYVGEYSEAWNRPEAWLWWGKMGVSQPMSGQSTWAGPSSQNPWLGGAGDQSNWPGMTSQSPWYNQGSPQQWSGLNDQLQWQGTPGQQGGAGMYPMWPFRRSTSLDKGKTQSTAPGNVRSVKRLNNHDRFFTNYQRLYEQPTEPVTSAPTTKAVPSKSFAPKQPSRQSGKVDSAGERGSVARNQARPWSPPAGDVSPPSQGDKADDKKDTAWTPGSVARPGVDNVDVAGVNRGWPGGPGPESVPGMKSPKTRFKPGDVSVDRPESGLSKPRMPPKLHPGKQGLQMPVLGYPVVVGVDPWMLGGVPAWRMFSRKRREDGEIDAAGLEGDIDADEIDDEALERTRRQATMAPGSDNDRNDTAGDSWGHGFGWDPMSAHPMGFRPTPFDMWMAMMMESAMWDAVHNNQSGEFNATALHNSSLADMDWMMAQFLLMMNEEGNNGAFGGEGDNDNRERRDADEIYDVTQDADRSKRQMGAFQQYYNDDFSGNTFDCCLGNRRKRSSGEKKVKAATVTPRSKVSDNSRRHFTFNSKQKNERTGSSQRQDNLWRNTFNKQGTQSPWNQKTTSGPFRLNFGAGEKYGFSGNRWANGQVPINFDQNSQRNYWKNFAGSSTNRNRPQNYHTGYRWRPNYDTSSGWQGRGPESWGSYPQFRDDSSSMMAGRGQPWGPDSGWGFYDSPFNRGSENDGFNQWPFAPPEWQNVFKRAPSFLSNLNPSNELERMMMMFWQHRFAKRDAKSTSVSGEKESTAGAGDEDVLTRDKRETFSQPTGPAKPMANSPDMNKAKRWEDWNYWTQGDYGYGDPECMEWTVPMDYRSPWQGWNMLRGSRSTSKPFGDRVRRSSEEDRKREARCKSKYGSSGQSYGPAYQQGAHSSPDYKDTSWSQEPWGGSQDWYFNRYYRDAEGQSQSDGDGEETSGRSKRMAWWSMSPYSTSYWNGWWSPWYGSWRNWNSRMSSYPMYFRSRNWYSRMFSYPMFNQWRSWFSRMSSYPMFNQWRNWFNRMGSYPMWRGWSRWRRHIDDDHISEEETARVRRSVDNGVTREKRFSTFWYPQWYYGMPWGYGSRNWWFYNHYPSMFGYSWRFPRSTSGNEEVDQDLRQKRSFYWPMYGQGWNSWQNPWMNSWPRYSGWWFSGWPFSRGYRDVSEDTAASTETSTDDVDSVDRTKRDAEEQNQAMTDEGSQSNQEGLLSREKRFYNFWYPQWYYSQPWGYGGRNWWFYNNFPSMFGYNWRYRRSAPGEEERTEADSRQERSFYGPMYGQGYNYWQNPWPMNSWWRYNGWGFNGWPFSRDYRDVGEDNEATEQDSNNGLKSNDRAKRETGEGAGSTSEGRDKVLPREKRFFNYWYPQMNYFMPWGYYNGFPFMAGYNWRYARETPTDSEVDNSSRQKRSFYWPMYTQGWNYWQNPWWMNSFWGFNGFPFSRSYRDVGQSNGESVDTLTDDIESGGRAKRDTESQNGIDMDENAQSSSDSLLSREKRFYNFWYPQWYYSQPWGYGGRNWWFYNNFPSMFGYSWRYRRSAPSDGDAIDSDSRQERSFYGPMYGQGYNYWQNPWSMNPWWRHNRWGYNAWPFSRSYRDAIVNEDTDVGATTDQVSSNHRAKRDADDQDGVAETESQLREKRFSSFWYPQWNYGQPWGYGGRSWFYNDFPSMFGYSWRFPRSASEDEEDGNASRQKRSFYWPMNGQGWNYWGSPWSMNPWWRYNGWGFHDWPFSRGYRDVGEDEQTEVEASDDGVDSNERAKRDTEGQSGIETNENVQLSGDSLLSREKRFGAFWYPRWYSGMPWGSGGRNWMFYNYFPSMFGYNWRYRRSAEDDGNAESDSRQKRNFYWPMFGQGWNNWQNSWSMNPWRRYNMWGAGGWPFSRNYRDVGEDSESDTGSEPGLSPNDRAKRDTRQSRQARPQHQQAWNFWNRNGPFYQRNPSLRENSYGSQSFEPGSRNFYGQPFQATDSSRGSPRGFNKDQQWNRLSSQWTPDSGRQDSWPSRMKRSTDDGDERVKRNSFPYWNNGYNGWWWPWYYQYTGRMGMQSPSSYFRWRLWPMNGYGYNPRWWWWSMYWRAFSSRYGFDRMSMFPYWSRRMWSYPKFSRFARDAEDEAWVEEDGLNTDHVIAKRSSQGNFFNKMFQRGQMSPRHDQYVQRPFDWSSNRPLTNTNWQAGRDNFYPSSNSRYRRSADTSRPFPLSESVQGVDSKGTSFENWHKFVESLGFSNPWSFSSGRNGEESSGQFSSGNSNAGSSKTPRSADVSKTKRFAGDWYSPWWDEPGSMDYPMYENGFPEMYWRYWYNNPQSFYSMWRYPAFSQWRWWYWMFRFYSPWSMQQQPWYNYRGQRRVQKYPMNQRFQTRPPPTFQATTAKSRNVVETRQGTSMQTQQAPATLKKISKRDTAEVEGEVENKPQANQRSERSWMFQPWGQLWAMNSWYPYMYSNNLWRGNYRWNSWPYGRGNYRSYREVNDKEGRDKRNAEDGERRKRWWPQGFQSEMQSGGWDEYSSSYPMQLDHGWPEWQWSPSRWFNRRESPDSGAQSQTRAGDTDDTEAGIDRVKREVDSEEALSADTGQDRNKREFGGYAMGYPWGGNFYFRYPFRRYSPMPNYNSGHRWFQNYWWPWSFYWRGRFRRDVSQMSEAATPSEGLTDADATSERAKRFGGSWYPWYQFNSPWFYGNSMYPRNYGGGRWGNDRYWPGYSQSWRYGYNRPRFYRQGGKGSGAQSKRVTRSAEGESVEKRESYWQGDQYWNTMPGLGGYRSYGGYSNPSWRGGRWSNPQWGMGSNPWYWQRFQRETSSSSAVSDGNGQQQETLTSPKRVKRFSYPYGQFSFPWMWNNYWQRHFYFNNPQYFEENMNMGRFYREAEEEGHSESEEKTRAKRDTEASPKSKRGGLWQGCSSVTHGRCWQMASPSWGSGGSNPWYNSDWLGDDGWPGTVWQSGRFRRQASSKSPAQKSRWSDHNKNQNRGKRFWPHMAYWWPYYQAQMNFDFWTRNWNNNWWNMGYPYYYPGYFNGNGIYRGRFYRETGNEEGTSGADDIAGEDEPRTITKREATGYWKPQRNGYNNDMVSGMNQQYYPQSRGSNSGFDFRDWNRQNQWSRFRDQNRYRRDVDHESVEDGVDESSRDKREWAGSNVPWRPWSYGGRWSRHWASPGGGNSLYSPWSWPQGSGRFRFMRDAAEAGTETDGGDEESARLKRNANWFGSFFMNFNPYYGGYSNFWWPYFAYWSPFSYRPGWSNWAWARYPRDTSEIPEEMTSREKRDTSDSLDRSKRFSFMSYWPMGYGYLNFYPNTWSGNWNSYRWNSMYSPYSPRWWWWYDGMNRGRYYRHAETPDELEDGESRAKREAVTPGATRRNAWHFGNPSMSNRYSLSRNFPSMRYPYFGQGSGFGQSWRPWGSMSRWRRFDADSAQTSEGLEESTSNSREKRNAGNSPPKGKRFGGMNYFPRSRGSPWMYGNNMRYGYSNSFPWRGGYYNNYDPYWGYQWGRGRFYRQTADEDVDGESARQRRETRGGSKGTNWRGSSKMAQSSNSWRQPRNWRGGGKQQYSYYRNNDWQWEYWWPRSMQNFNPWMHSSFSGNWNFPYRRSSSEFGFPRPMNVGRFNRESDEDSEDEESSRDKRQASSASAAKRRSWQFNYPHSQRSLGSPYFSGYQGFWNQPSYPSPMGGNWRGMYDRSGYNMWPWDRFKKSPAESSDDADVEEKPRERRDTSQVGKRQSFGYRFPGSGMWGDSYSPMRYRRPYPGYNSWFGGSRHPWGNGWNWGRWQRDASDESDLDSEERQKRSAEDQSSDREKRFGHWYSSSWPMRGSPWMSYGNRSPYGWSNFQPNDMNMYARPGYMNRFYREASDAESEAEQNADEASASGREKRWTPSGMWYGSSSWSGQRPDWNNGSGRMMDNGWWPGNGHWWWSSPRYWYKRDASEPSAKLEAAESAGGVAGTDDGTATAR